MTSAKTLVLILLFFVSIADAQVVDTVYTDGKIYTVNEERPWAEAVAIKDGKFIKVGSADDVKALIGEDTEVVDLGGKFVLPGLVDTHTHPFETCAKHSLDGSHWTFLQGTPWSGTGVTG